MRVHMICRRMTMEQADLLEYYLRDKVFITDVKVNERTGDAVIFYSREAGNREAVIDALSRFSYGEAEKAELVPDHTGRALNRQYETKLVMMVVRRALRRLLLPLPLRRAWAVLRSIPFIAEGLRSLSHGRIEVSVLDASAIAASMLRGDFATASSVMFLLRLGEILEEWTHRKSVDDLARSMSLKIDKVWIRSGKEEVCSSAPLSYW